MAFPNYQLPFIKEEWLASEDPEFYTQIFRETL
jgi:hypothetical protein